MCVTTVIDIPFCEFAMNINMPLFIKLGQPLFFKLGGDTVCVQNIYDDAISKE